MQVKIKTLYFVEPEKQNPCGAQITVIIPCAEDSNNIVRDVCSPGTVICGEELKSDWGFYVKDGEIRTRHRSIDLYAESWEALEQTVSKNLVRLRENLALVIYGNRILYETTPAPREETLDFIQVF